MFYGAKPEIFRRARMLREKMTIEEKLLWNKLKDNQLSIRFKPQHPIDIYIADFYCHALKLVIEIDDASHQNKMEQDENRTNELERFGITVIRFTNSEVKNDFEKVIEKIKNEIERIKN